MDSDEDVPLSKLNSSQPKEKQTTTYANNEESAPIRPSEFKIKKKRIIDDDNDDDDDDKPLSTMSFKKTKSTDESKAELNSQNNPEKRKRDGDDFLPNKHKNSRDPDNHDFQEMTEEERERRRIAKMKRREERERAAAGGSEPSRDHDKEKHGDKERDEERQRRKEKERQRRREAEAAEEKRKHKLAIKPKIKLSGREADRSRNGARALADDGEPKSERKAKAWKDATRIEKLDMAMKAFKWWESPPLEEGILWRYLEHNGIVFPPEYQPHGMKLLYNDSPVELNAEQEELATMFANMPMDGPQLGNEETRKIFESNFFKCFKQALGSNHVIKKFDGLDFSLLRDHLDRQKIIKKSATEIEKKLNKEVKEAQILKYGYAIVDGHLERVGNTTMEPPGLFRGRGKHPKMGMLKKRVIPEQVSLNIGENARPPKCPLPGHAWASVQHDPTVTWLATWNENIMGSNKYVQLAASSSFKGKSDINKYNKAAMLKGYISKIREDYRHNLWKKNALARQIATAMWIIDVLALRVGGEKGEDEADTVGCCSLRVEHIKFPPSDEPGKYLLDLNFLGKDSMEYKQTIDFGEHGEIGRRVWKNFAGFCKDKKPTADVFDQLQPSILNAHLSSLMPGLSAKVFRTYNASETLQNELPKSEELEGLTLQEKVLRYNDANRKVAILCNHQRTVSKAAETQFENLQERLDLLKIQRKELKQIYRLLKEKKHSKVPLQSDKGKMKMEKALKRLEEAKKKKAEARTVEEKKEAMQFEEDAKQSKLRAMKVRNSEAHLFAKMPTTDVVKKRVFQWQDKIKKLKLEIQDRDSNKEVALGTSKINYMDPRISVAWCKRNEVPIEKIFSKTLRDKFNWACAVPPDWRFDPEVANPSFKLERFDTNDDGSDADGTATAAEDPIKSESDTPIKLEIKSESEIPIKLESP